MENLQDPLIMGNTMEKSWVPLIFPSKGQPFFHLRLAPSWLAHLSGTSITATMGGSAMVSLSRHNTPMSGHGLMVIHTFHKGLMEWEWMWLGCISWCRSAGSEPDKTYKTLWNEHWIVFTKYSLLFNMFNHIEHLNKDQVWSTWGDVCDGQASRFGLGSHSGCSWFPGSNSLAGLRGQILYDIMEYPLVMSTVCYWKWPIEIVDLPINSMVIFHSYVSHNQRVLWIQGLIGTQIQYGAWWCLGSMMKGCSNWQQ